MQAFTESLGSGLPFPIPNLHTSYSFSVFKLLDNPASKKPL